MRSAATLRSFGAATDPCKTELIAPRPLMSLATRLSLMSRKHSAWRSFLPHQLQQNPELVATAVASVPALVDGANLPLRDDDSEACFVASSLSQGDTSSTCSTSPLVEQSAALSSEGSSVMGHVWELSQDPIGSRVVQEALERANSEEERCALAQELDGHVIKTMRCPHGNHVLQKIISVMQQPESLQFIVDALTHRDRMAVQAAKHRYGCRIVQHLLKACPPDQVSRLAENLLQAASTLACHTFGHFVVQHLLQFGTKEHQHQLVRCIEQNALRIGQSAVGGGIIEKALKHAAADDKAWVARAVAQDPQVLLTLAHDRRGHICVLLVLEILNDRGDRRIRETLVQHLAALRASRYGRIVAQILDKAGEKACL